MWYVTVRPVPQLRPVPEGTAGWQGCQWLVMYGCRRRDRYASRLRGGQYLIHLGPAPFDDLAQDSG